MCVSVCKPPDVVLADASHTSHVVLEKALAPGRSSSGGSRSADDNDNDGGVSAVRSVVTAGMCALGKMRQSATGAGLSSYQVKKHDRR